ncbi:MAG: LLM class flavin-dependent oxidoreductase [Acidimicrobiales bacterium]
MHIGISLTSSHDTDPPSRGGAVMVERAIAAHRAGLSSLTVGDHHAEPSPYQQNTPILGRLLAEWSDRPAGCLFLLPLWSPVLVAEQVGTLAGLLDAPFILQTGIGRGRGQFASMGANLSTRGVVTDEMVRVVKGLLAGETVTSERLGVGPTRIGLRPERGVEWWIGGHADAALDRAAAHGDVWYAGPGLDRDTMARLLDRYRSACSARGTTARAVVRQDVLVLANRDRATERAAALVAAGYRGMGLDQLLVGDAEDAAAALADLEALGFEQVIIRCASTEQDEALETIEQFGRLNQRPGGPGPR